MQHTTRWQLALGFCLVGLFGCRQISYISRANGDEPLPPISEDAGPLPSVLDAGAKPPVTKRDDGGPTDGDAGAIDTDSGEPAEGPFLRVATWNIEWLNAQDDTGNEPRVEADYAALRRYAAALDADVIAVQEVESEEAVFRVFDASEYAVAISTRSSDQRAAIVYRKSLQVVRHPDVTELDTEGTGTLRYGVDVEVTANQRSVRFLSVHLKSGCFDEPLDSSNPDCTKLKKQCVPLEAWIDARAGERVPFAVMGDFNRRFDAEGDTMFDDLSDGVPMNASLLRVTEGRTSACNRSEFPVYIDHIVLDPNTASWLVPSSFEQIVYSEEDATLRLSDHCPIRVDLALGAPP